MTLKTGLHPYGCSCARCTTKPLSATAAIPPFTRSQVEKIQAGAITGTLISATPRPPKLNTVRALRRIVRVLDGEGNQTGDFMIETLATRITITTVTDVLDVLFDLTVAHARVCGHRTPVQLRDWWTSKHPRIPTVRLVTFNVGDRRDQAPLLAYGAGATMNPTRSPDPTAPLVPYDATSMISNQATVLHKSMTERERRARKMRTLAARMKWAERENKPDELAQVRAELEALETEMREAA